MQVAIDAAMRPSMRLKRKAAVKLSLPTNSAYQRHDTPAGGNAMDFVGLNDVATTTAIGPSRNRYTAATTIGSSSVGSFRGGRVAARPSGRTSVAVSDTLPPD